jgi:hypothetical protein
MSMSEGVTVTVSFAIKPELADAFVESIRGMFPVTRLRKGFRNIRLLIVMSGVRTARHYLPKMIERGWGRVVFISSEIELKPIEPFAVFLIEEVG